jgi:hypothetical protein
MSGMKLEDTGAYSSEFKQSNNAQVAFRLLAWFSNCHGS